MKLNIKKVTALGIGIALFVVSSYIAIPTGIPNTSIQTRVAVLGLFGAIFGPVVGFFVGFLGHAIADALQWGSVWWSWVIAEGILGFMFGLYALKFNSEETVFSKKEAILFNVVQITSNVICWAIIAPLLDIVIYAEPHLKVFLQGITSAVINSISVGVITTILLFFYSKRKAISGDLKKED